MKNIQINAQEKENSKTSQNLFTMALERAFSGVPQRSIDIVKKRYGIFDGAPKTLEDIGREFQITRERVRQIIKEVVKKVKTSKIDGISMDAKKKIEFTIKENDGIIKEEDILNILAGNDPVSKNTIRLLLELFDDFVAKDEDEIFEKHYHLNDFESEELLKAINAVKKILEQNGEVLKEEELYREFIKNESVSEIDKKKFLNYLKISKEIKPNSFGKWGLNHWAEISPRVAWQRAYLIMKEAGKPLHFTEIARLIDRYNISKKKAHPQTIHNELIKNEKFVLVGRGIYALAEWGYKKGTVKELIEDILRVSHMPLRRDEILEKISQMRQVKKSTILINLNNFFARIDKDKYAIRK
ncbi:MAG: hypothetical protein A3J63_04390 [Candidatus Moranbacteria bacterium RIFCSPHIGHO2_02_FULL_40_12b]|nr:MAG: hypothetical protein A3J63_04390 [Candidatus Moranbacteria bacterium RIFCSPHIGHO2_02_FULL_40_12b]OGI23854.1 MAG: hypothetical protein A3E91_00470 [Candidatus Moranbacteria bacterium RIFCSPHIGHO2_12_FULL_40_10]